MLSFSHTIAKFSPRRFRDCGTNRDGVLKYLSEIFFFSPPFPRTEMPEDIGTAKPGKRTIFNKVIAVMKLNDCTVVF